MPTCLRSPRRLVGRRAFSSVRYRPAWSRPTGSPSTSGAGTREIRISDAKGIFRVMYVAKLEEAVYVLHCFQKKTQATSKQDKDIAAARYRTVLSSRKGKR